MAAQEAHIFQFLDEEGSKEQTYTSSGKLLTKQNVSSLSSKSVNWQSRISTKTNVPWYSKGEAPNVTFLFIFMAMETTS